jgi:hypothetical protein
MSPGPLRRAFGPGYTLWSSMAAVALLALAILLLAATTPFVDQLLPGLPGATFRHAVAYERKPAVRDALGAAPAKGSMFFASCSSRPTCPPNP